MPLLGEALALIRANLEGIQKGRRVGLIIVGTLTEAQLNVINQQRNSRGYPPMVAEVVFLGKHIYAGRIVRDGYTIDDVIDQIASAMDSAAVVLDGPGMTAMQNPCLRKDRYGNCAVRDKIVFESSVRHPRLEIFTVAPKGDHIKPKRPPNG
jgi:hypothetical protein